MGISRACEGGLAYAGEIGGVRAGGGRVAAVCTDSGPCADFSGVLRAVPDTRGEILAWEPPLFSGALYLSKKS